MEKSSKFNKPTKADFLEALAEAGKHASFTEKISEIIAKFYFSYEKVALKNNYKHEEFTWIFVDYIQHVLNYLESPFEFDPYHKQIRVPYDYFQFGVDFLKPLVHLKESTLRGENSFQQIRDYIEHGENVILLANHQIEADPMAISLMLIEHNCPKLAKDLIYVAGERVLTDPLSVPFSMGCNLLCIYSKRYIDHPPEKKAHKQHHNKKTMQLMSELLSEGGKCIYVAPSGGRDRRNDKGVVVPAEFDPQSIEMLYLMSKKAKKKTHFFPLALSTYTILPPPETVQIKLGEDRVTEGGAIHLAFGEEIDMNHFPNHKSSDKHLRRKARADYIYNLVVKDYQQIS